MATMFWIWMATAAIFLIAELVTPTMIMINFAVGALVAGIYAQFVPGAYYWQLGIFAAVSIICLPFTRRFANRISRPAPERSNVDRMLGQVALVTEPIDPDLGGKVRFEGEVWVARATEPIAAETKVRITGIHGTKVTVERLS